MQTVDVVSALLKLFPPETTDSINLDQWHSVMVACGIEPESANHNEQARNRSTWQTRVRLYMRDHPEIYKEMWISHVKNKVVCYEPAADIINDLDKQAMKCVNFIVSRIINNGRNGNVSIDSIVERIVIAFIDALAQIAKRFNMQPTSFVYHIQAALQQATKSWIEKRQEALKIESEDLNGLTRTLEEIGTDNTKKFAALRIVKLTTPLMKG